MNTSKPKTLRELREEFCNLVDSNKEVLTTVTGLLLQGHNGKTIDSNNPELYNKYTIALGKITALKKQLNDREQFWKRINKR